MADRSGGGYVEVHAAIAKQTALQIAGNMHLGDGSQAVWQTTRMPRSP